MISFQQSEQIDERRQWMFQLIGKDIENEVPAGATPGTAFTLAYIPDPNTLKLVLNGQLLTGGGVDYTLVGKNLTMITTIQSTDIFLASYSVPALTGQTGYGYISKNGAAAVQTTNQMVEIDATNMPGFYYIRLSVAEVDTLGFLGFRVKTSQSLEFQDKAVVSYNDPYTRQGGWAMTTGSGGGIKKEQAASLLKDIRKIVQEEIAKVEIPEQQKMPDMPKMPDYTKQLEDMATGMQEMKDYMDEMMDMVKNPEKPTDYTKMIEMVNKKVDGLQGMLKTDLAIFEKTVKDFDGKMKLGVKDINDSLDEVAAIKKGFAGLQKLMDEFNATLADQKDMDRRFDAMTSGKNEKRLEEFSKKFAEIQKQIIDVKYDILTALTTKGK